MIEPPPASTRELQAWREHILQILLWTAVIFGALALLVYSPYLVQNGRVNALIISLGCFLWLLVITLARRLPYPLRAASAAGMFFLLGTAGLLDSALSGSGLLFLLAFTAVTALLFGFRAGLGAVLLSTAALALVGAGMINGRLPASPVELSNPTQPAAWLAAGAVYLLLSLALAFPLAAVVQLLEANPSAETSRKARKLLARDRLEFQEEERNRHHGTGHRMFEASLAFREIVAGARSRSELIQKGLQFFQEITNANQASVYLLEPDGRTVCLRETLPLAPGVWTADERIPLDSDHPIAQSLASGETRFSVVSADSQANSSPSDLFLLPLAFEGKQIGVLALGCPPDLEENTARWLERIAAYFATALEHLPEGESGGWRAEFFNRISRSIQAIALAESAEQIYRIAAETLVESGSIFAVLVAQEDHFRVETAGAPGDAYTLKLAAETVEATLPESAGPAVIQFEDLENPPDELPVELVEFAANYECQSAIFLPVRFSGQLEALFFLGNQNPGPINHAWLEPYRFLAEFAAISLNKVHAARQIERRLDVLQTLSTVSQALSVQTDPEALYRLIHEQVLQFMGPVDFTIALYHAENDSIEIAYSYEGEQRLIVEPFPLGEGLTSILVRTRQPLLLVKDTERRAVELGAKLFGKPARSWLGVPLMLTGEVTGAVIVQDLEQEGRFDEDDVNLLTNLAAQIAVVVDNARLLKELTSRVMQEQIVNRVAAQAFSSLDLESLLRKSVIEIGQSLDVSRVQIRLSGQDPTKRGGSILF